ncbi:MAG: HAD family hydrolase [Mangrovicoccus sp.]
MSSIQCVIFDCDGVLIDSEVISAAMLIEELQIYGVVISMEYVAQNFLGRSYPVVLKTIRQDFGIDLPEHFEADYRRRLLQNFERDLRIMPGARELIDQLAVPYGLATSSSPPRLARSLEIVGLTRHFENRCTTSSEVENGKPAPDIFLLAASKMNIAPEHCLVIEDSVNGIKAGLAAGMQVFHFTGGSHLKNQPLPQSAPQIRRFACFSELAQLCPEIINPEMVI